jgi:glyoxylase-like metal-dependent hydrolase (beta-lactamase superfamily II)
MTLDGTNTWVLLEPGSSRAVVVDPGPLDEGHLDAIDQAVAQQNAAVSLILLTHGHSDHSQAARSYAERHGVAVRALDAQHRLGAEGLDEGDVVDVDGLIVRVMSTPGHTADSLTFVLPAEGALLTGDTVLGRGTTLVAYPDGKLAEYFDSLDRLASAVDSYAVQRILPGHGPTIEGPAATIDSYRRHRQIRLEEVRALVAAGASPGPRIPAADDPMREWDERDPLVARVVREMYANVDQQVWWAAALSVAATLEYLRESGELAR